MKITFNIESNTTCRCRNRLLKKGEISYDPTYLFDIKLKGDLNDECQASKRNQWM